MLSCKLMKELSLIFPDQLYKENPALKKSRTIVVLEEHLYFSQYKFLKQKLMYQRACMKSYAISLEEDDYKVQYIDAQDKRSKVQDFIKWAAKDGYKKVHTLRIYDDWLSERLKKAAKKYDISVECYDTPGFINSFQEFKEYGKEKKSFYHADFYEGQRKKLKILVDDKGDPVGGKWSYDADNRKKLPKSIDIPAVSLRSPNEYISEAIDYAEQNFKDNPGTTYISINDDEGWLPTNHRDASKWLGEFLRERFELFGKYEDAISTSNQSVFHSMISPMLNMGLLTPHDIVKKALSYASDNNIPVNSLEGFIRQVIGWREFMLLLYLEKGRKLRTSNYWKFKKRKIPKAFYTGETGVSPVDNTIKNVLKSGYAHHIERLMILGNFMLLCEVHPDEVYKWFMELFLDAYDWVMVPNVYGMSQYAAGDMVTTKPYINGSNYIKKMSDYKNGDWTEVWDALFWRFIATYRDTFEQNHRMTMMVSMWDKMKKDKQNLHLDKAEEYLENLWK